MSRINNLSRFAARMRVAVLAMVALGVAGCSDSGRFEVSNPFKDNNQQQAQAPARQDVTGSVTTRPATATAVQSQPLPAISRPQTVAAHTGGGVAQGGGGLGAYRPSAASNDITGSVTTRPAPSGRWTWEGGTPVTVGPNETAESVGRRHGVPVPAILEANGLTSASQVRPGQRLVIPRYVLNGAAPRQAAAPQAPAVAPVAARNTDAVHVVAPGETLMSLSRRFGVSLNTLAKTNNIAPSTKLNVGDRLTIPSGTHAPMQRQAAAPKIDTPRTVATERVATIPAQTANVAKTGAAADPAPAETVTKSVEPAGAMPSFRWPVRGRVIATFGPKTNGQQNDGINLAVPEGTPVKAAEDGVVAYAGNELKGYGNLVLIRHANGFVSAYAHASEITVKRGEAIKRGQVIARAGQTGNVTSPQLHFEIRKGSTPVDPTQYLNGA